MTSQDFLNYTAGIAIWVFIGLGVYIGVSLVRLFTHLKKITKVAFRTAVELQLLKSTLKKGFFGFFENALSNFMGGGVARGKRR